MSSVVLVQWAVALAYLLAGILLLLRQRLVFPSGLPIAVAAMAFAMHLAIVVMRGLDSGQIPIVTRYEDFTVDALAVAGIYLVAQWRWPELRLSGVLVLCIAAIGVIVALKYSRGIFPMGPALRTNWLVVHASLNSLAIGFSVLTFAASLLGGTSNRGLLGRLMGWTFFYWAAMIASGSYWASIAWGRFWGWDPIECWSLATLLLYGYVMHLRFNPAWCSGYRGIVAGLAPFGLMMFTTYALVFVMRSVHGQYVFQ